MNITDETFSELETQLSLAIENEKKMASLELKASESEKRWVGLKQENELLLLQLHQVQEKLESAFFEEPKQRQLINEAKLELEKCRIEKASLSELLKKSKQRLDVVVKESAHLTELEKKSYKSLKDIQEENKKSTQDYKNTLVQVDELKVEAGLLLLQLHQAQEGFEGCFVESQKREKDRLGIIAKLPFYAEEVELLGFYKDGQYQEIKWLLRNLYWNDKILSTLHFKFADHGGVPTLVIRPETEEEQGALVWPEVMADQYGSRLVIKPGSMGDESQWAVLSNLSSANYRLVCGIVDLIQFNLIANKFKKIKGFDRALWMRLVEDFKLSLRSIGTCIRYNSVEMGEIYIDKAYERLWVKLHGLDCAGRVFAEYQFKIILKGGGDGVCPSSLALVFRDLVGGGAPLYVWPPKESDEFGSFLSLEFDLNTGSPRFDVNSLCQEDLVFIETLLVGLPVLLFGVLKNGEMIGRHTMEEWGNFLGVFDQTLKGEGDLNAPKKNSDNGLMATDMKLNLSWKGVELYENYHEGRYAHLGIRLVDVKLGNTYWSKYEFKVFARKIDDELTEVSMGIEFRLMDGEVAPLLHWPPAGVESDDYGEVFKLDQKPIVGQFPGDDQILIEELIAALPVWLDYISESVVDVKPSWPVWQLLLQRLKTND